MTIGIGETLSDVIVALVPARKARITGTAVDSQGRPMTGQVLMMRNDSVFDFAGIARGPIRPDGSFTIERVTAGTYTLEVNGPSEERASTEIIVGDGNLDGIQVFGTKAVTATGRVVVDPVASPLVRSGSIEVFATPAHPAGVHSPVL